MATDVHTAGSAIASFLRSGRLPFLGREGDVGRIAEFLSAATDSHELRIALVLAEAGMGKSRLVEEALPRLAETGTAVLHVKLYPEGATALPPLLADALAEHPVTSTLLRQVPERTVAAVASALRRIARLRPTAIVLEDLHLLAEESLREFARLLEAVADESLSVICLARPQEFRARGVAERWTVSTIELAPLDKKQLTEMWNALFGGTPSSDVLETLHDATRGNLLALRSALRGVLGADAVQEIEGGSWRVAVSLSDFRKIVRHAVELVVEGMVAHIDLALIQQAEQLATLGEVFSTGSAQMLIKESEETIEALRSAGIVVTPTVVPRAILSGEREQSHETACAFSHSLLHQYLIDRHHVDSDRLLSIIAARRTLYSFRPLTLLLSFPPSSNVDAETIRAAYRALYELAYHVNSTTDWELTPRVVELAASFLEHHSDAWNDEERRTHRIDLLSLRATIDSRSSTGVAPALLEEMLQATEAPRNGDEAAQRIDVIRHLLNHHFLFEAARFSALAKEIHALVATYPPLRNLQVTVGTLYGLGFVTFGKNLHDDFAKTWEMLREMADDPALDKKTRAHALLNVSHIATLRGETEAVIVEQRELLRRAREEMHHLKDYDYEAFIRMRELIDFARTGNFREFFSLYGPVADQLRMLGRWQNLLGAECHGMLGRAALGADLDGIRRSLLELVAQLPPAHPTMNRITTAMWPIHIGVLRNDPRWARGLLSEMLHPDESAADLSMLMLESAEGDLEVMRSRLAAGIAGIEDNLPALIAPLVGATPVPDDCEAWTEELRSRLRTEYVSIQGHNTLFVLLRTLQVTAADHLELYRQLLADIRYGFLQWMDWLAERGLHGFMRSLAEQFDSLLTDKESNGLRTRIEAVEQERQPHGVVSTRIQVSMLGSIRVGLPGESLQILKGVRIRTLLALMIADRMLRQPLSSREFLSIAASDELDYELARKKRNMGVVRLREVLGAKAILTDGETPQLDLSRIEVDLLEAHQRIEMTQEALRERSLARAAAAVLELLEITRGEVAFPGLYEEFFEAARDEFDLRVRKILLQTLDALEGEEDWERAEEIVRKVVELEPENEEMSERLASLLARSNRKLEAVRLGRRAEH